MKSAVWLLVLVACAGSPAPEPETPEPETTSTPVPACPSCPTCEQRECPACPECVKAPEPVATSWYCLELIPPREGAASFCWPSSSVCEGYREKAKKKGKAWGKPSACRTEQTAFCFYLGDPRPMNRQTSCALTMEHCDQRRQVTIDNPTSETSRVSACRATLNTDTFSYDDNGDVVEPVP